MKSKKFEDLRGTNTAIHCKTKAEAEQVDKMLGSNLSKHWSRVDFCINIEGKSWDNMDFYASNNFTIIPAADFIAANNKQAPDLSHFLPPLPSELVPPKRIDPEIDIQNFANAFNANMEIVDKRLQLMVDLYEKLQVKFEYIEKRLTEIASKQINPEPAISQTPAEPEVKLPVTIEEVFSGAPKGSKSYVIQSDGNIRKYEFNEIDRVDEYRKESTAKKVRAFIILKNISEAQNEIEPRGETVWVARKGVNGEIFAESWEMYLIDYEIIFHSEQGLLDCIAANRELWMDLLNGE